MARPTFAQTQHFYRLVDQGLATSENFQTYLEALSRLPARFCTVVDNRLGLMTLIEGAVGESNLQNINRDITPERFPLTGIGIWTVNMWVEPFLDRESGEDCAKRLVSAGRTLENTGELAAFLKQHPGEVEKWSFVLAIGENSRFAMFSDSSKLVPCASARGVERGFGLQYFREESSPRVGVLVSGGK